MVFAARSAGSGPDRDNARERIELERTTGRISADDAALLDAWIIDGFVILPQAVPHRDIDRLNAEVEDVWARRSSSRYFVEFWEGEQQTIVPAGPSFKDRRVKLLDLHGQSDAAREILFAEPILRFLTLVFNGPALAFQSLYFRWGSGQEMHQDSAFVKVSSPREMAASWVALEDVSPDSGELEYYVGSHYLDDYLFDGRFKWMPFRSPEYSAFVESLHARSRAQGLPRQRFLPRKGDVLI